MVTKKELLEDNGDLVELLDDICCFVEEKGLALPEDIADRVEEFLGPVEETERGEREVIEIEPE